MAGADAAVFVFLEAQGGEVHGGVLFVFMEWGGKLREILAGGQFRASLSEAEGPTDQRRDDQSEDRDRNEIFHDASCDYLDIIGIIEGACKQALRQVNNVQRCHCVMSCRGGPGTVKCYRMATAHAVKAAKRRNDGELSLSHFSNRSSP